MNRIRFRPRVEECELRFLPQGGPWHVLHEWQSDLNATYRSDARYASQLADPYCPPAGDPGPCAAWPDVVQLRAELYELVNRVNGLWYEAQQEVDAEQAELQRLQNQNAPLAEQVPVANTLAHDRAVAAFADADYKALSDSLPRQDDKHLVQWADGVWQGYAGRFSTYVTILGVDKKATNDAYRQRLDAQEVLRRQTAEYYDEGVVSETLYVLETFEYLVR